jgi:DNA topoisomerase-2
MTNKSYTSKDIKVLSDHEHIRKRTAVYLGNMNAATYSVPIFLNGQFEIKQVEFIPAVYKAVGEIIDNAIDEFSQISIPDKRLVIEATPSQGIYSVSDNGRGVPIDKHETGKYTPEVVFGSLRSGRNFNDDEKQVGVIGVNGVGSSCVVATSTEFKVEIQRNNKKYSQAFVDGASKIYAPSITSLKTDVTGTKVSFQLDNTVFSDVSLSDDLMANRAIELAFNNPELGVQYNTQKYKFKKGFDDVIKTISTEFFKFSSENMDFYVVFDAYQGVDEAMFTWVNSSLLFDGGICNTQFTNAFYDQVISHLEKEAKKQKCEVSKNDVRSDLLIFGVMKLSNATYDSQAKTRLTGPNMRKEMVDIVANNWTTFSRKNKLWLDMVLSRAYKRYHSDANDKATKDFKKSLKSKVPGLLDAVSKDRTKCTLFVTEGLSAASSLIEVRDPNFMASFPLGGKINNVYGSTVAQVLKMGKLTDLLASIGLVPGEKAHRRDLRFNRVVIAVDADYDGNDIMTTLICLFYQFWPNLFDPNERPYFYQLMAPNVVAVKGKKRVHFASRYDFEKGKSKVAGYTISYYKGLGSQEKEDWEMIVNSEEFLLPITGDDNMENVLQLLFGPDSEPRKSWLMSKGG